MNGKSRHINVTRVFYTKYIQISWMNRLLHC